MIDQIFTVVLSMLSLGAIFISGILVGVNGPGGPTILCFCCGILLQVLLHSTPMQPPLDTPRG